VKEKRSEGPRAFSVFIAQVDEGSLHEELSEEVQKLASRLCEFANRFGRDGKGELTLTLGFAVDAKGVAAVTGSIKTKLPKVPRVSSQFYLTAAGNLSLENPRQQKLPLREVPAVEAPRDLVDDVKPTRSL
jgi:hypothetical protein